MISQFNAAQVRRGLSPSTIERREYSLRKFDAWLSPGTLTDATTADVEAFIDSRRWCDKTVYDFVSCLHAFYKWALRQGLVASDPTEYIDRPRLRPGLPRPISDDDLACLISQSTGNMRSWILLGAFAGLRCAEIAAVQRDDIMFGDPHQIRVLGKGRKERIVPLHPTIYTSLRAGGMPHKGRLWTNSDGSVVDGGTVSRIGGAFIRSCGVDATMHQLRHWFGTNTYRHSQDVLATAGLMGHSNPATVAIYAAFSPNVATAAVLSLTV